MRKFLTILLIILLITAAAVVAMRLNGGLAEMFSTGPDYDEELYKAYREAEVRGDYTAMNAAFEENMNKTGVSFFEEDYDPTHGGLIYTYDYSASSGAKKKINGRLYIVTKDLDQNAQTVGENDFFALDRRTAADPEYIVMNSYLAGTDGVIRALCQRLLEHEELYPTDWERTLESMVSEWKMHNMAYAMGYKTDHSQHVNLNNADEDTDWLMRAVEELT